MPVNTKTPVKPSKLPGKPKASRKANKAQEGAQEAIPAPDQPQELLQHVMSAEDALRRQAENERAGEMPMWEPVEGETELQYAWFHEYLMMGASRGLIGAYNLFQTKHPVTQKRKQAEVGGKRGYPSASEAWTRASRQHSWYARAVAWDAQQRKNAEQKQRDTEDALRARLVGATAKSVEMLEEMQKYPLHQQIINDVVNGVPQQIILNPMKWSQNTMIRMHEMLDKQLNGTGPTGSKLSATVEVDAATGNVRMNMSVNVGDLSDEELMEVARSGTVVRETIIQNAQDAADTGEE